VPPPNFRSIPQHPRISPQLSFWFTGIPFIIW
jgi:hypothetical protein